MPDQPQADPALALQAALAAHQDGRHQQAEQIYRGLLAADPANAAVLLHLGTLCLQQDRPAEAVALSRRAVAGAPDSVEAHIGLATALLVHGETAAAIASYEDGLALAPDHPEANYGLATALHALQRHDEAAACYQRALAADPEYPEAEFGLGAALQATRRYNDAIRHYGNALALYPEYGAARHALGTVLQALGRHAEALAAYRTVLAAEPDRVETLLQAGAALQALGQHAEALRHLARARALRPDADSLLRHGNVLQEIGRLAEARDGYAQAIASAPQDPRGYLAWFGAQRIAPDDPHLAAAEALVRNVEELPDAARTTLHFALGKAYADLGRHPEAFAQWCAGNRLQRAQIHYDEAAVLGALARTAAICTPALLRAHSNGGDPATLPVFIVGMPRCGSTLLEQILASHPAVVGGGERMDFGAAVEAVCGGPGAPAYPELMAAISAGQLQALGARYVASLRTAIPPGRGAAVSRVTDKRLDNFALAGLIHLALPRARIIHVRRDPVDTCLSCFATMFAEVPYASDLGELGRYYHAYRTLMAHWQAVLPAGTMLEVRYDALVADLPGEVRRVLDFCGLEWNDACLAFHATERAVRTASMTQVRQPLYRSSVGRWRPPAEALRPLLDALGPD